MQPLAALRWLVLALVLAGTSSAALAAPSGGLASDEAPEAESEAAAPLQSFEGELSPWWTESSPERPRRREPRSTYRLLGAHVRGWAVGGVLLPLVVSSTSAVSGLIVGAAAPLSGAAAHFVYVGLGNLTTSFLLSMPVWVSLAVAVGAARSVRRSKPLHRSLGDLSVAAAWGSLGFLFTASIAQVVTLTSARPIVPGIVTSGALLFSAGFALNAVFFKVLSDQLSPAPPQPSGQAAPARGRSTPRLLSIGPGGLVLVF